MNTLYKKTSTGKIEQWTIWCEGNVIITKHGQVDGKLQINTDVVLKGKNKNKVNATTPEQQAELEVKAKYQKQLKKGYVESIEQAAAGEVNSIIEGGIPPMLAHKYSEHGHKIKYNAYVQRKYDGTRCIASIKNGKCTLWSRTRKPINSMPHIVKALEAAFSDDITLDGELFCTKTDFEGLISLIRPDEAVAGHEVMEYHVYDVVMNEPYAFRLGYLKQCNKMGLFKDPLVFVDTYDVADEEEMLAYFGQFIEEDYEGLMIRNADGVYKHGRSYDLLKVKSMLDDEFPIVGVKEGRGKMAGKAIFICQTKTGTVDVKMEGKLDNLTKYLTDKSLWEGKLLTVQYQGLTASGSLRFPVGKTIRDYE